MNLKKKYMSAYQTSEAGIQTYKIRVIYSKNSKIISGGINFYPKSIDREDKNLKQ